METQPTPDPFADGADETDDPFADPPADASSEVAAEPPAEGADIPVVDREGDLVDPAAQPPVEAPEEPTPEPPAQPAPEQPAEQPPAPAEQPQEPAPAVEPPQEPETTEEPASEPETEPAGDGAQATGPRGGVSAMRHYKILYQTGEGQWTERKLTENVPQGVTVVTADGEPWVEARNNDHALRLGYVLLDRPDTGVTIFPVPKGAWKPKRVKPAPPAPSRERLEIS